MSRKKFSFLFIMIVFIMLFTLNASGMGVIRTGNTHYHSISDTGYPCGWESRSSTPIYIAQLNYHFDYSITYDTVTATVDSTEYIYGTQCKVKADMQICSDSGETISKTLGYTTGGSSSLNGKWGATTAWTHTTYTNDWATSSVYMHGN